MFSRSYVLRRRKTSRSSSQGCVGSGSTLGTSAHRCVLQDITLATRSKRPPKTNKTLQGAVVARHRESSAPHHPYLYERTANVTVAVRPLPPTTIQRRGSCSARQGSDPYGIQIRRGVPILWGIPTPSRKWTRPNGKRLGQRGDS